MFIRDQCIFLKAAEKLPDVAPQLIFEIPKKNIIQFIDSRYILNQDLAQNYHVLRKQPSKCSAVKLS